MSQPMKPQATSPLATWLAYLEQLHSSSIDLGLERADIVAQRAGLKNPAPCVITVAGTNGKGSTCALMESILLDAGYNVGVYSSPHLIKYNERVRINGVDASDEEHSRAFFEIDSKREAVSLSLFEFGTLAALYQFKQHKVDVVLLEVGLGGRLDATNVVDHDVSVITSLAIDHVDWLGDDIDVIGYEKAGIFRAGKPAICGQPNPPATVSAHADDIDADLHQVGYQFHYQQQGNCWQWSCGAFELTDLPLPQLPLPNAATALMALSCSGLTLSDENIVNGLINAQLPGRMQVLGQHPLIILDVAHNPHSAEYLINQITSQYPHKKLHAVVGMLHDKDIQSTLAPFRELVDFWYLASLAGPRAATASELEAYVPSATGLFSEPVSAFELALHDACVDDLVLVFGSFYTVGQVWEYWQNSHIRSVNGE
ncbi:MAG: bifunctional tetrahydrofolate synthase/dihydrofolate synthase [Aliivibrio sp.]|uniref:bifunctional tetrahydrofolate synthase/dihydrofolate synthase n=1 Tax=Aliivibrio sp. TaxID=1872443 RepID=UPI001A5418CC|nr:bifunctional tetrahydrofolate synthase/dihydrofolate synthase [Aliivibrio sp.]